MPKYHLRYNINDEEDGDVIVEAHEYKLVDEAYGFKVLHFYDEAGNKIDGTPIVSKARIKFILEMKGIPE